MTAAQKKFETFTVSMEPKWVDVLPIYLEALNKPSTYTDARLRDEFAVEPWCAACEDALGYSERKALQSRRTINTVTA